MSQHQPHGPASHQGEKRTADQIKTAAGAMLPALYLSRRNLIRGFEEKELELVTKGAG